MSCPSRERWGHGVFPQLQPSCGDGAYRLRERQGFLAQADDGPLAHRQAQPFECCEVADIVFVRGSRLFDFKGMEHAVSDEQAVELLAVLVPVEIEGAPYRCATSRAGFRR